MQETVTHDSYEFLKMLNELITEKVNRNDLNFSASKTILQFRTPVTLLRSL